MTLEEPQLIAPSPSDPAAERAVAAARRVADVLLRHTFSTEPRLVSVAEELEGLADRLEPSSPSATAVVGGLERGERYSLHDPISGAHNPYAPPVEVSGLRDGSVRGRVEFGLAHQGPPGIVHGGVLAMVLDHVLALANSWSGLVGMTGRLDLRYLRPSPLFSELVVTARQDHREGRKIVTTGEITLDGEPCVTATGVFIAFAKRETH